MLEYNGNVTEGVYTLSEFMAACEGKAAYEDNQETLDQWLRETDMSWMGLKEDVLPGENHDKATRRLVKDGWRRGVDLMQEVMSQVTVPMPKTVRRVQRWQAQGDDVEMQRVWHGDLDHAWRGTHRDFRSGPQRVRLLIDSIESGGQDANVMRWRGVAALKLADALTEAGYSVQVEGVIHCVDSSNDTKKFTLRTIVKDYTAPVDLLTLAACSALPAYFRSLMHTWGLVVAKHSRWGVSYQVPEKTPVDRFKDAHDDAPAFMLEKCIKNADTACKAVERIVKAIEGE